jgi:surface antigen
MAAIGGLFAVAGLPAYAVTAPDPLTVAVAVNDADAQSISVTADVEVATPVRDAFSATTPEALAQANSDAVRAAQNARYLASGAQALGDDYPWPYEITDDDGGGLSPLNYYYRECVDFVAWRLNRDAGSFSAPFKYVWSNLTPSGGDGSQWMSNWKALGRTVSNIPIAGAVAYTGGNHVAYVKSANADGTVTLEEYNLVPGAYSQRTIPAASVVAFLYPPG